MALESGPESRVRTPGAKESDESSEVAKVRVTKGRDSAPSVVVGGNLGSSIAAEDAGKLSSDMVIILRWKTLEAVFDDAKLCCCSQMSTKISDTQALGSTKEGCDELWLRWSWNWLSLMERMMTFIGCKWLVEGRAGIWQRQERPTYVLADGREGSTLFNTLLQSRSFQNHWKIYNAYTKLARLQWRNEQWCCRCFSLIASKDFSSCQPMICNRYWKVEELIVHIQISGLGTINLQDELIIYLRVSKVRRFIEQMWCR